MFINDIEIPKYLYLIEPIDDLQLINSDFEGPIKNSANLTKLEFMYHIASGFKPHNSEYMGDRWFTFDPTILDKICFYASIKFRFAYAGLARKQLNFYSRHNPYLKRLLHIKPSYILSAKIKNLNEINKENFTIINYQSNNVNEFIMEKQYWEEYINKKYFKNDIKNR